MSRLALVTLSILSLAACQRAVEPADAPAEAAAAETPAADPAEDAAWRALEDRWIAVNVKPTDPVDAVEWTEVRCNFLGGEIGGDNSEQDRAVQSRMEELGCGDDMLAEARALKTRMATDTAAVARLDAVLTRHDY